MRWTGYKSKRLNLHVTGMNGNGKLRTAQEDRTHIFPSKHTRKKGLGRLWMIDW
jgi:hypothetical protein